jgi:deoxyribodipyrimidine photo-lyase
MSRSLFIFRQDLRLHDNHWLRQTVATSQEVFPVFIFDTNILDKFPEQDPRLWFIAEALRQLDKDLQKVGSYLTVCYGDSIDIIQSLATSLQVDTIARNRSYGDNSLIRDKAISDRANTKGITTKSYNDYLLVEPEEVIPMKVFTPFKNRWLKELATKDYTKPYTIDKITTPTWSQGQTSFPLYRWDDLIPAEITKKSHWHDTALRPVDLWFQRMMTFDFTRYDDTRNIPSIDGSSKLSPYTRFWLVSIRELYRELINKNDPTHTATYISELARREYRQHTAHHFPESRIIEFQEKKRKIARENSEILFKARCEGRTGYPMVDAGMRQLVTEKRMHGRTRMVVASFLTKDLLIDRRRGEQFFAQHLLDYDANVNIGNRQRSASVWADPKPMRIFSPMLQSQRFDPTCTYIKKYIPELENIHPDKIHDPLKYDLSAYGYVRPIIDHYEWSKKAKAMYKWE